MAITKIQSNAFPPTIDLSNVDLTLGAGEVLTANIADANVTTAKIADGHVTHAKLHTDMDLSGKTVTLPTLSQTVTATAFVGDGSGLTGLPTTLTDLGIPNHDDISVDGSGNVGIGTSSPSENLHVFSSSSNADAKFESTAAGSDARLFVRRNGNSSRAYLNFSDSSTGANWYTGLLRLTSDSFAIGRGDDYGINTDFVITNSGNVGIGTTAPSELLHLKSGGNTRLHIETSNAGAVPEIRFYNTSKLWRVGEETSTDSGGGAYNNSGASDFVINNSTDNQTWVFTTDGKTKIPNTLQQGFKQDIGRVDQGNTGNLDIVYGLQRFQFSVISDGNWYNVLTNFRECTGHMWATVSDASSRSRAEFTFTMTSPAYGVSAFSEVAFYGGGWNTGDFEFRYVSDGSSSFILQVRRTSYYSSSNISNGRLAILLY